MRFLALSAFASLAAGHICLMEPVQRGGFNVSDPGDWSCFQPQGPCGTVPAGPPQAKLVAGATFDVRLQQNLNHYNPGHPGFIDVAITPFPATESSNFTTLARVSDYWPHLQATQTNFSIPVTLPADLNCPHCVLRVRYHPNKETESIFHNCADVMVVSAGSSTSQPRGRFFAFTSAGTNSPSDKSVSAVPAEVLPTGELTRATVAGWSFFDGSLPFAPLHTESQARYRSGPVAGKAATRNLAVEGMATSVDGVVYTLDATVTDTLDNDMPVSLLHAFDTVTGRESFVNVTFPEGPTQWTALVAAPAWAHAPAASGLKPLALVGVIPQPNYNFQYQLRLLDPVTGAVSSTPLTSTSQPTDTFVNFFWASNVFATNGGNSGQAYLLGGDENNLFQLDSLLYTASISSADAPVKGLRGAAAGSTMTQVSQNITKFTLSGFHVHPTTGVVYAVSPGLYGSTAFHLVRVDPATGDVLDLGQTTEEGEYAYFNGGNVYGASIDVTTNSLYHVFKRVVDGALVLARIDLSTGRMDPAHSPVLATGVNGEVAINTVVRVAPRA